jgi:hypothetical protein
VSYAELVLARALKGFSAVSIASGILAAVLLRDAPGSPVQTGRGMVAIAAASLVALIAYTVATLIEYAQSPLREEDPNPRPAGDDCAVAPATPLLLLSRRRGEPSPHRPISRER